MLRASCLRPMHSPTLSPPPVAPSPVYEPTAVALWKGVTPRADDLTASLSVGSVGLVRLGGRFGWVGLDGLGSVALGWDGLGWDGLDGLGRWGSVGFGWVG